VEVVGAKERKTDGRRSEIDEEDILLGEYQFVLRTELPSDSD
jgi:hypothetical protein